MSRSGINTNACLLLKHRTMALSRSSQFLINNFISHPKHQNFFGLDGGNFSRYIFQHENRQAISTQSPLENHAFQLHMQKRAGGPKSFEGNMECLAKQTRRHKCRKKWRTWILRTTRKDSNGKLGTTKQTTRKVSNGALTIANKWWNEP